MDINKYLILIKDEDKTEEIESFDVNKNTLCSFDNSLHKSTHTFSVPANCTQCKVCKTVIFVYLF